METRRYRVTGIVQGVGFRPFIHKLTKIFSVTGWILNDSEGVLLEVQGSRQALDSFVSEIETAPPPLAKVNRIIQLTIKETPRIYSDFEIRKSVTLEATETLIPPDSNVCDDCLHELYDKNNRRYGYPFINCTNCGPRYSIIEHMPYDRPGTTMKDFIMCPECKHEYEDITNRRYHAQPNACPVCGPSLILTDNKGLTVEAGDIIAFTREKLGAGKIFAVKSIGGFHLVVNARDDRAVRLLREKKKRDLKPFALMVIDIKTAQSLVHINPEEQALLESVQRPIVLLRKKDGVLPESIAPHNPNFGLMLPSAPLHYLLLDDKKMPVLIMTSGNISGSPIVYKNEDAFLLGGIADYILSNNRDIFTRVDDSIVRYTTHKELKKPFRVYFRRSRGYAPYPVSVHKNVKPIMALGSELKNTMALSKNKEVFISQHIGDIKNDKVFNSLLDCSKHMQDLLSINPEFAAADSHPGFRQAVFLKEQDILPVTLVQHHHAHMASCMAENKLDKQVIGVIFDGTGYGPDGTIWGGEFLVGDYSSFERFGSIAPFYLLGGERAILEPFRVAIDLLYRTYGDSFKTLDLDFLSLFEPDELLLYGQMAKKKINVFQTSSMGRLFDGISALLQVCTKIEYEAQAAIELESLLNREFDPAPPFDYNITNNSGLYQIDFRPMVKEMVHLIQEGNCRTDLQSRRFHSTCVNMIISMCSLIREKTGLNDVVLSGGVFLNEFLSANAIIGLEKSGFAVYYHTLVPPGDGGISLGQIMAADAVLENSESGPV